jgi:hypothetical protein
VLAGINKESKMTGVKLDVPVDKFAFEITLAKVSFKLNTLPGGVFGL